MSRKGRGEGSKKLWLRLCVALGAAPINEAYVSSTENEYIDGFCELKNGSITIAPHTHVVDTVIHELLHRMYPDRSERSVRRSTSMLLKTLTDEDVQWFYEEYQRRKITGKARNFED